MLAVVFASLAVPVGAEQLTVKDCFKNPEKCQDTPNKEDTGNVAGNDLPSFSAWDFFKMIGAMILVIVLIYVVLRFMNKNRLFQQKGFIENLGGTQLAPNRSVQMIKISDRIFIVGVGENIQLLKEIDDGDEIKEILKQHNNRLEQMIVPNAMVVKAKGLFKKNNKEVSESESFQTLLNKQLKDLSDNRKTLLNDLEKKGGKQDE